MTDEQKDALLKASDTTAAKRTGHQYANHRGVTHIHERKGGLCWILCERCRRHLFATATGRLFGSALTSGCERPGAKA